MDMQAYHQLPQPQREALEDLCQRYGEKRLNTVIEGLVFEPFDLPEGYIAGCVARLHFGISPEGSVSS